MLGSFMQSGAEILRIGEAKGRELKVTVAQDTEPHFRSALGQSVDVRIDGRAEELSGELKNFAGEASRALPHPALTATADGPLPVRHAESGSQDSAKFELADPHFTATVKLPESASDFADGELALVRFHSGQSVTVFNELRSKITRWVQRYGGS